MCLLFGRIRQLDDASRSVFRENVRLNEALKLHMKETQELEKQTKSLTKLKESLILDKVRSNIVNPSFRHVSSAHSTEYFQRIPSLVAQLFT